MNYNIGDKVLVRNDLVVGRHYGFKYFNGKMDAYQGMVLTIVELCENDYDGYYKVAENDYGWSDKMFKGKVGDVGMTAKYKVGDKVRIKEDLYEGESYGNMYFNDEMEEMCGEVVTIEEVCGGYYEVEENGWSWTDEMFEGKVEDSMTTTTTAAVAFTKDDLLVGMGVLLRNGDKRIVMNTKDKGLVLGICVGDYFKVAELVNYNDNLENVGSLGSNFDIMKVYGLPSTHGKGGVLNPEPVEVIWERNAVRTMTLDEISAMLGFAVQVAA